MPEFIIETNESNPVNPIDNDGNSFTGLSINTVDIGGGMYETTVTWDSYSSGVDADGLYLKDKSYTTDPSTNITQFGFVPLANVGHQFWAYAGTITATDSPTSASNMDYAFAHMTSNPPIGHWGMWHATTMVAMFSNANNFNQDLSAWDVSSVTNMSHMFQAAHAFNYSIENWDMGLVTIMDNMFNTAHAYNHPFTLVSSGLENTSAMFVNATSYNSPVVIKSDFLTNISHMFRGCISLDSPVTVGHTFNANASQMFDGCVNMSANIIVGNYVSDGDLLTEGYSIQNAQYMFRGCTNFNQDISNWAVYDISDGKGMFSGCTNFNQDISHNFGLLNDASYMFENCTSLDSSINIIYNNNCTTEYMFSGCTSFNKELKLGMVLSDVYYPGSSANTSYMFSGCTNFNQYIGDWEMDSVITVEGMFQNCLNYNQDVSGWFMYNVQNFSHMFSGALSFNKNINPWQLNNALTFESMFSGASNFNNNGIALDISSGTLQTTRYMLANCGLVQDVSFNHMNSLTDVSGMFLGLNTLTGNIEFNGLTSLDDASNMFNNFQSDPNSITLSDTTSLQDLQYMFINASAMTDTAITITDGASGMNASYMFQNATNFNGTLNLPFNKISTMWFMFWNAASFNQNINDWDLTTVLNLGGMFQGATAYQNNNVDISINIPNATQIQGMFIGKTFTVSIRMSDMGNVNNVANTFNNVTMSDPSLKIELFDANSLTSLQNMFFNATLDISEITITGALSATSLYRMFRNFQGTSTTINIPTLAPGCDATLMFTGALNYNGQINLDFTNINNTSLMFDGCGSFNQDLTSWDMRYVQDISNMFLNASAYNNGGNALIWDISSVPLIDNLFSTTSINVDVSLNNAISLTSAKNIFGTTNTMNGKFALTDANKLTTLSDMFNGCTSNFGGITITGTNKVESLDNMFRDSDVSCNITITDSSANLTAVDMFYFADKFNHDLILPYANLTDVTQMFYSASKFNQNIDHWTMTNFTDMTGMFRNASSFRNGNVDISWNLPNVTDITNIFASNNIDVSIKFVNCVSLTTVQQIFSNCVITNPLMKFELYDANNLTTATIMFNNSSLDISEIRVEGLTSCSSLYNMFGGFAGDATVIIKDFLPNTNATNMFVNTSNFNSPIIMNTTNINNMDWIFSGASKFNQNINDWDFTNVTATSNMFNNAPKYNNGNVDISWNLPNVTSTYHMFKDTSMNIGITLTDLNNVNNLNGMFQDCNLVGGTLLLTGLDHTSITELNKSGNSLFLDFYPQNDEVRIENTTNVNTLASLFEDSSLNCNFTLTHSAPDISVNNMFKNATAFNGTVTLPFDNIITAYDMFTGATAYSNGGVDIDWSMSSVVDTHNMFLDISSSVSIKLTNLNNLTVYYNMFRCTMINPLSKIHLTGLSSATNLGAGNNMFSNFASDISEIRIEDSTSVNSLVQLFMNSDMNTPFIMTHLASGCDAGSMFEGADRFNSLLSLPFDKIDSMRRMFYEANAFNQNINDWNLSNVTLTDYMFYQNIGFNNNGVDISLSLPSLVDGSLMFRSVRSSVSIRIYDLHNATNILQMVSGNFPDTNSIELKLTGLTGLTTFASNNPVNGLVKDISEIRIEDTINVKYLTSMFYGSTLNTPIVITDLSDNCEAVGMFKNTTRFNTRLEMPFEKIKNMNQMFMNADAFDQNISHWNVSNVTNMESMFQLKSGFNNGGTDLSWNIPKVATMYKMFEEGTITTSLLFHNANALTNVNRMFYRANLSGSNTILFDGATSLENAGNSTSSEVMFYDCNLYIDNVIFRDTINLTNMENMFRNISGSPNVTIDTLKFPATAKNMFLTATSYNGVVTLPTEKITDMGSMFSGCSIFNQPLTWDLSNCTTCNSMFINNVSFNSDISFYNTEKITTMGNMFNNCDLSDSIIKFGNLDALTSTNGMFKGTNINCDISLVNTLSITSMNNMFKNAPNFTTFYIENTDTLTQANNMFESATSFNSDISWNCPNVANFQSLLNNATSFDSDVTMYFEKITNLTYMFSGATNYNSKCDLSFNTSVNSDMTRMFDNAYKFNQDITQWNASRFINTNYMFQNAHAFNQDLSGWNLGCTMYNMFYNAKSFNQNLGSWPFRVGVGTIFVGTAIDYNNYTNFLIDLSNNDLIPNGVNFIYMPFYRIDSSECNIAYDYLTTVKSINFNDSGAFPEEELQTMHPEELYPIIEMDLSTSGVTTTVNSKYTILTDAGGVYKQAEGNIDVSHTLVFDKGIVLSLYSNNDSDNNLSSTNNHLRVYDTSESGVLLADVSGNEKVVLDISSYSQLYFEMTIDSNSVQTPGFIAVLEKEWIDGNICFQRGTEIVTDQGTIPIERIKPELHTIRGRNIRYVTEARSKHDNLVLIRANAFGTVPYKDTILSREHKIMIGGRMMQAKNYVNGYNVIFIPNSGEILYNILMDTHNVILANGILSETLHPENLIAKIYSDSKGMTALEKSEFFKEVNYQIKRRKVYSQ